MTKRTSRIFFWITTILLPILYCASVHGADSTGYKGWEKDSPYNKLYSYKERDKIKGKVIKFQKITPLAGMAPGTALVFKEGEEDILVHVCPWAFASPKETGIQKGVKTKIRGSWALIADQDVFIAAKVKQGDHFEFKVRLTKDGTPFWTMSPEELANEKKSK